MQKKKEVTLKYGWIKITIVAQFMGMQDKYTRQSAKKSQKGEVHQVLVFKPTTGVEHKRKTSTTTLI